MKPFFSRPGQRALAEWSTKPTLWAFDFDGTLAPITLQPRGAYTPDKTVSLMKRLCSLAPVAVISGRKVSDLKSRLGFSPQFLIGNHGAEGVTANNALLKYGEEISQRWRKQLKVLIPKCHPENGVFLEDKGCSLTLHYRRTENRPRARRLLMSMIQQLEPTPRLVSGKLVVNVIPEGLPHKGEALHALMKKNALKYGFFVGDDDTDEDVFRHPLPHLLGVRVGSHLSAAEFFVARQVELERVIRQILFHLEMRVKNPPLTKDEA